jgi:hypothetical protein
VDRGTEFDVVADRWDVYDDPQYRPLSSRAQVPEGRRFTVCLFWLPSAPLKGSGLRRHGYDCSACHGFTAFGIL